VTAAAALQHPNIVSVFDHGETDDGRCYLVMEFVDGIDLSKVVRDFGRLYIPEACEYVRQAALGLQHAHDSGFVHRDIKPSNILVAGHRHIPEAEGPAEVKILDMGLVRAVGLDDELNRAEAARDGSVVGTPDYMAPEQARNSNAVDHRADLYSLGATLYFLLAGRPPFPEGSPVEKLLKHISDPPPPVQAIRREVPNSLAQLIVRLLAKRPENRLPTARDLARALEPFCTYTGEPPADPNPELLVPGAESVPSADTVSETTQVSPPLFGPESSVLMPVDPRLLTHPDPPDTELPVDAAVPPTPVDIADSSHPTPPPVPLVPRKLLEPPPEPVAAPAPTLRRPKRPARRSRTPVVLFATLAAAAAVGAAAWWNWPADRPDPVGPTPETTGHAHHTDKAPRAPGRLVPLSHRIPHDSGLVMVVHPAEFMQSRLAAADRVRHHLDRAAADTGFDFVRSDRVLLAATRTRPAGVVGVSEGVYVDAAFAERYGRTPTPLGRTDRFAAVAAPGVYAISDGRDFLTKYLGRTPQPPRGVTTDLLDALRAAEGSSPPLLVLAVDGHLALPGGSGTLKVAGVDSVAARAWAGDKLRAEVVFHGPERQALADFVPKFAGVVREKFPRFRPVADAVEAGRQTFTQDGDQYRLAVSAEWTASELAYWLELLLGE
jgi:serine/threonine-protein kinase